MLPDNLGHIFDSALHLHPSATAVVQDDRRLTFADLDRRCNQVANLLRGIGVTGDDRVALLFDNDYRFLECCLGPMRIGAVPVPLNIRAGDDALAFILDDCEAEVVIASEALADRASGLTRRVARVRHLVVDGPPVDGALRYALELDRASVSLETPAVDPDSVCMQPYTSGSTGKPKGVLLTHRGQIWNADIVRKAALVTDEERALVAVPLYHKNAMIGTVKPFLLAGASFVILRGFEPLRVIEAIERYRITFLTGVPAMFKMILAEKDALARHDVSSVRYAVCGSAEVPEALLADFERTFGATMAESYGLTEGGPVPIINTRWGFKKRGSCGMAFPGCEVKLIRDDGVTETSTDEPGELVTRNPGLARGYWKRPEATAAKFRDGWLYTGDLMRRDADGFYYFVGRKDDMINVAGENVYPKEVEDLLLRHPGVRDVCVVPMPHAVKGAVPVAFVVRQGPDACSEEDLKRYALEHGAPYAHPRRIFFLDAMPLGGTGKTDRGALGERAVAAAENT